MFLSNLSIKRPIFATVMMLALVTLGIFSYRRLAIDMYPDVEIPVLSIVTKFPGASPETVEREVTKRIEEAVNPIPGVKHVISISRESVSQVVVEFNLEVRINEASQEARAKVNTIRGDLPQAIEEPIIQKLDVSAIPVVSLAVRSERLSPRELTTLVEKKVKRRFENLSGVGKVDLVGESKREVNVLIDPVRLEALEMGVDEVMAGLQSENVNTPLGRLNREASEFTLRISGKPEEVEGFKTMVIGQRHGRPVTLGEVAEIRDGIEEQRSLALVNGIPAVSMDILKQSGANTVAVVERVKKEITRFQKELPAGDPDRDGPRRLHLDPGFGPGCPGDHRPRGHPDHPDRLLFPQFLAVHGHHRIDPAHLGDLLLHRHELHGHDPECHDPDGPVSGHRSIDR